MTEHPVIVRTRREIDRLLDPLRGKGRIGFVPTMGALHEGHASLVRAAVDECDETVVSVFVNPTQFGPGEDFDAYPRTWEADRAAIAGAGAGIAFLPAVEEIYPPGPRAFIEIEGLSKVLCGARRPGHFRGVATVVWKLLQIVNPDAAYFGAKDAQQIVVLRRIVEELLGPWKIRSLPTVRESDGLAMSSRNRYLAEEERAAATALLRGLRAGRASLDEGERDPVAVVRSVSDVLGAEPLVDVEYVSLVSLTDLMPVARAEGNLLLAVAARVGRARLIDNFTLRVGEGMVQEILP